MHQSNPDIVNTAAISGIEWLAFPLVFAMDLLHIYSGIIEGRAPVLLAGLGFFGAIVLYLAAFRHRLRYLVGILYRGSRYRSGTL